MENGRNMTLKQFIDYMNDDEAFQVCTTDDEWENYIEVTKDSKFLKPFMNCRISCMGAEILDDGNNPTIRICLDDSGMVYL